MSAGTREDYWRLNRRKPQLKRLRKLVGMTEHEGILGLNDQTGWRPYLPESLLEATVKMLHEHPLGGHLGPVRLLSLLTAQFVLVSKGKVRRLRDLLKGCVPCQQRKPPLKKQGLMASKPPTTPWRMIAMDFVGPYLTSKDGFKYVLVMIDQFTKWVELATHQRPEVNHRRTGVLRQYYLPTWLSGPLVVRPGHPFQVDAGGNSLCKLRNQEGLLVHLLSSRRWICRAVHENAEQRCVYPISTRSQRMEQLYCRYHDGLQFYRTCGHWVESIRVDHWKATPTARFDKYTCTDEPSTSRVRTCQTIKEHTVKRKRAGKKSGRDLLESNQDQI